MYIYYGISSKGKLLTNKLFAQLPQPFGFDRVGSPRFDAVSPRIGDMAVLQVRAVLGYGC